jgi:DNA-directed RNA polymerase subunit N (RpoN/RPB10)
MTASSVYFIGTMAFLMHVFCSTYNGKNTLTFELNKIQGAYKSYKQKVRNLNHLEDILGDSTPIFGNSSSLNYYFVNIYIGNPPQKQSVIIDTGSHLTSVPCMPYCLNCGRHINPYYDTKKSNMSELVNCNSDSCKQFNYGRCEPDNKCSFQTVKYFL